MSPRSEEHTSELQSLRHLVCRLLLEKKKQRIRAPWGSSRNRSDCSSCQRLPGSSRIGAARRRSGFFFNDTATTEIYTLSLHDALPIYIRNSVAAGVEGPQFVGRPQMAGRRSEEHTSELQSLRHLVCRLLLEKKKT